jgi:hypothetical protein
LIEPWEREGNMVAFRLEFLHEVFSLAQFLGFG